MVTVWVDGPGNRLPHTSLPNTGTRIMCFRSTSCRYRIVFVVILAVCATPAQANPLTYASQFRLIEADTSHSFESEVLTEGYDFGPFVRTVGVLGDTDDGAAEGTGFQNSVLNDSNIMAFGSATATATFGLFDSGDVIFADSASIFRTRFGVVAPTEVRLTALAERTYVNRNNGVGFVRFSGGGHSFRADLPVRGAMSASFLEVIVLEPGMSYTVNAEAHASAVADFSNMDGEGWNMEFNFELEVLRVIPEPSSLLLGLSTVGLLGAARGRRRR